MTFSNWFTENLNAIYSKHMYVHRRLGIPLKICGLKKYLSDNENIKIVASDSYISTLSKMCIHSIPLKDEHAGA